MAVELSEAFFAKVAGWEAMKRARAYLEQGQVLSSNWSPPLLKGVVQAGGTSYRAGLVIKNSVDIENVCTCREAREWGTICAHSVGVGLHHLRPPAAAAAAAALARALAPSRGLATAPPALGSRLQRHASDGEPASVHIIFPPNLEQAAARGRVSIFFEGDWKNGRSPLNALSKSTVFRFDERDARLLDCAEEIAGGETPAMLILGADDLARLLPALAGHPRVTVGKSTTLTVSSEPWAPQVQATLQANGEIELRLAPAAARAWTLVGSWVWQGQTLRPFAASPVLQPLSQGPAKIPREQVPIFLSRDWPVLAANGASANFKVEDFQWAPRAPEFVLQLQGGLAQLHALLQCRYGTRILTPGPAAGAQDFWLPDAASVTTYLTRDFEAERAGLARLLRAGFTGPDHQGRYQLVGETQVLNFFARDYPKLEREWEVTLDERLGRSTSQKLERIEPRFEVMRSGVEWFELGIVFSTPSGEKFSAADIQRLVLSGQNHTRLRNGRTAVIDTGAVEELQEVLLDCAPLQDGQGYRLKSAQAGFLESSVAQAGWKLHAPRDWHDRAAKQSGAVTLECPPLGPLETVLRPYQKAGVAWMHFLREHGFGGILADEMGLGKTLQALALLAAVRGTPAGLPFLVVCPTSLVFNWLAEARRFTPALRVLGLQGSDRADQFAKIPEQDLIVTSYALMRRDAERYRGFEFDTVILDEAQHIKNRQSQNAQAVKAVRARHHLVLSGTPLENSVLDLWSIFDFLMPGYLGTAQDFRERYEVSITRERNAEAQARLARRLKPFLLRRLKREVAQELPERIEQVSYCELTRDQRGVYQQVIEASRKEVLEAVGAQGLARSRMVVLSALLRLRQTCCDLRLLDLPQIDPANASAKLDLLEELLDEVVDGGHRVLVFSQFTRMLALVRERLEARGLEYCYLDGATRDRGEVVQRFQATAAIPVFLISLKAGGVGLNLTGADTVIHFDPWWNPAVEDQATGRAHRIGQTRVVTSYKLIARDTIEEKILLLQERKRELFQAMVEGEERWGAALTWEDVQELLSV